MPRSQPRLRVYLLAVAALAAACGRTQQAEAPVATPSLTLARNDAAIGMPIEMTYRFVVAPNAPRIAENDVVFVHFLDTDGELMWTDDHEPPVPTTEWAPGRTIEYPRTMFVPKFPYAGETTVELGVYSPKSGVRVPLSGETRGQHAYQVAKFTLHPQTDNLYVVFKDGWHETEVAEEVTGVEWQWSKKAATLAFRNPMRDVVLYLQCDQPVQDVGAPRVELRIGNMVIDSFALPPGPRELRKVELTAAQLGTGETVEVTVAVDKSFVPATITQLKSSDTRELGIRVFRAYVQAK
ncbi:MAG TPA: hypothetical protein VGJ78_22040 [Vicinamibacterales bacterium]